MLKGWRRREYCISVTRTYIVSLYLYEETLGKFKIHLILAFCLCIFRRHLAGDFTSLKCILIPILSYYHIAVIYVVSNLLKGSAKACISYRNSVICYILQHSVKF
jgi:hypothetical protein